jgi:hypothetical protein
MASTRRTLKREAKRPKLAEEEVKVEVTHAVTAGEEERTNEIKDIDKM